MPDGTVWKTADATSGFIEWDLRLVGLTDAERTAMEAFFAQVEGRLKTFTFLDPVDNSLARSDDFAASEWVKDALLQVIAGVSDPLGGSGATRLVNSAQISQRIQQTIAAPGWFTYCASIYLRSDSPLTILLQRSSVVTQATWQRVSVADQLINTDETMTFGLEVPAGGILEVFGFQAEAQPAASEYKRTGPFGGVYSRTRFIEDRLEWTAEGPNSHSTEM